MSIAHRSLTLILGALLALPVLAGAAPRYSVSVVGVPNSIAYDINSSGVVVGEYYNFGPPRAFAGGNGAMLDLGSLGGSYSGARAINDSGVITGSGEMADGSTHAFRYIAGGGMVSLGTLGGDGSAARGINNSGHIVGSSRTDSLDFPGSGRAFLQDASGMHLIAGLPNGQSNWAEAINNRGDIGGSVTASAPDAPVYASHAFLLRDGGMRDLVWCCTLIDT